MVLSALDDDAHRRALTIPRPGQAIVQTDAEWHYARATYLAAALPPAPVPAHAVRLDH